MTTPISVNSPRAFAAEAEAAPAPAAETERAVTGMLKRTKRFDNLSHLGQDEEAKAAPAAPAPAKPRFTRPIGSAAPVFNAEHNRDNFLRRISRVQKMEIFAAMDSSKSYFEEAESVLEINPDSEVGYRENTANIMRHYIEGNINKFQAARLFLYEACRENANAYGGVPIICDLSGELSNFNLGLLKEGFPLFNEEDWTRLEQILRDNPEESWDFFAVQYPLLDREGAARAVSKGNIDLYSLSEHILDFPMGYLQNPGFKTITALVVPPLLWTKMLEARFGERRMHLDLILGYQSREKLSNTESRVTGVPCYFVPPPLSIHDIVSTDPLTFYGHDAYYHLFIESANIHREVWTTIAKHFQKSNIGLFQYLVDRNLPLYAKPALMGDILGRELSLEDTFWCSLPYLYRLTQVSQETRIAIMDAMLENQQSLPFGTPLSEDSLQKLIQMEPKNLSENLSLKPWQDALRAAIARKESQAAEG